MALLGAKSAVLSVKVLLQTIISLTFTCQMVFLSHLHDHEIYSAWSSGKHGKDHVWKAVQNLKDTKVESGLAEVPLLHSYQNRPIIFFQYT